jgi:hypothetical protein
VLCLGHGSQTSIASWYPLPSIFDTGNRGHWANEPEFQSWVADIQNGGQPKTQSQWRKDVRGGGALRRLKANMASFSAEFLDRVADGGL